METTKHFSELINSLRSNPVGFLKLFFKSNMNAEELDSWDPDSNEEDKNISLNLDLYEGRNLFLSLTINWDDIEELDCEESSTFLILEMEEGLSPKKKLRVKLDFPIPDGSCGECYISEYEDEDEEAEESNPNKTQTVTTSFRAYDDENKRMSRKRKLRNVIIIIVIILLAGAWYLFVKK